MQLNILINSDGHAVIADFGLGAVLSTNSFATIAESGGGTERWMAPELLDPEQYGFSHCSPSKESDIYAFGMVIYEVSYCCLDLCLLQFNLCVAR